MGYGIRLEVWGDYASFNRPEMKVERVSYDVMTPSAARGILEAIYWKPQFRWVIDRIRVLAPVRFTHVRRNEISEKISARNVGTAMRTGEGNLALAVEDHRQQRAAMILRDVRYGIEAHLEVLDPTDRDGTVLAHPEAKHLETFRRRASRGQYFHHPYLGCREFPASFRLLGDDEPFPECPEELRGDRDLGFMLWDLVFHEDPEGKVVESHRGRRLRAEPRFFRARMVDGVIDVPPPGETRG
jgi:CRISPR-associated protein Cas5d